MNWKWVLFTSQLIHKVIACKIYNLICMMSIHVSTYDIRKWKLRCVCVYCVLCCCLRFFNLMFLVLQRNCIEFALKAKPIRRYIPKHRIQYRVWWFVTSQPFEYTIFILIMLNTITLAMKFHNQPESYEEFLDVLNVIFTAVFAMEFVFKLAAFRFKVSN